VTDAPRETADRLVSLEEYVALRGLSPEAARLLAAWPVVRTAAHELGHALTLRADGWPILFVTTIGGPDYGGMVFTGATPEGWTPGVAAASKSSSRHAAHAAAERVEVEMIPAWLELAAVAPDPDATAEATARLAPDDRENVAASLARASVHVADRTKEAELVAAYGEGGPALSATWQARGERDVDQYWHALLRLLPALLRSRVWTGEDLENAIADA
jgi:hypothetical protein